MRLVRSRIKGYNNAMAWNLQSPTGWMRLNARRYRWILIASATTLVTSAILFGLIGITRWQGNRALKSDTHTLIAQVSQQLVRTLQSRRGTLTFIRDTLNRRADLTPPQLQAMGLSAVEHTRHLLSVGLIQSAAAPTWWAGPAGCSQGELAQLDRAIVQRTQVRGVWSLPSTFLVTLKNERTFLVMFEPLHSRAYQQSAVAGVFDLTPTLEDFFSTSLPPQYPVQVLDEEMIAYRSTGWQPLTQQHHPIVVESPISLDAAHWTMQMQPGHTGVTQTLSWFNILLVTLSIVAGLGVIIIVWLLTARTWILQRLVSRRTAALRRTSERLRQMAITDELTGLYNRRFFLDRWEWEWERAKRYQRPLACLMVDVNGFKQVNDHLGHHTGDLVLKQIAKELKTMLRQSDILARFGGDEFIIALPETSAAQAESVVDKLRQLRIRVPQGPARGVSAVSLSVGMSRVEPTDKNPQDMLEAADQSLYASKRHVKPAAVRS